MQMEIYDLGVASAQTRGIDCPHCYENYCFIDYRD